LSRRFSYYVIASLSGASALVFENLWFRAAALALGSGAWSSALVLSAFMAGIALGNLVAVRFEGSLRRPIRAYAGAEVAIGLTGGAALLVLPGLPTLLAPAFRSIDTAWATNVLRVSSAFLVLVIPSASMGATLPLLMRALADEPGPFGRWLGMIYGANTAGAVVGVLACELMLLPALGVYNSSLVALSLNMIAGALALRLERRPVPARSLKTSKKPAPSRPAEPVRWLLLAGCFTGVLFLSFEAMFFRFQLLFFTSLSTTFAVMLAVALAGIAVGGAAAGHFFTRDRHSLSWLPTLSLGTGLALLLSYRWFPAVLASAAQSSPVTGAVLTSMALAFPVALLSGAMFTLLGQAIHAAGLSEANTTARLTIANTIGGAAGSLLTGFYLIGTVGLEMCFRALIFGYIAVGIWLATRSRRPARSLVGGGGALVMSLALFPGGAMRDVYQRFPIAALEAAGEHRVAFREGQLETVQYLRADVLGRPSYYRLVVNNHSGQRGAQPPLHASARVPAGHSPSGAANGRAARLGVGRHRAGFGGRRAARGDRRRRHLARHPSPAIDGVPRPR
jgi:spermidine synthase